jgi:nucleoside-diphosphate-sugar epimerase
MSAERDLDILVYGATGFVGRLTAEYLARSAPQDVRIGHGGRSRYKPEQVRSSSANVPPTGRSSSSTRRTPRRSRSWRAGRALS